MGRMIFEVYTAKTVESQICSMRLPKVRSPDAGTFCLLSGHPFSGIFGVKPPAASRRRVFSHLGVALDGSEVAPSRV
jgi:hypothetical protein